MARTKVSLDSLRGLLRAAGLRSTAPRVAVLQHLQGCSVPLSHGEFVAALASHGYDAATIYRNLIDLEGAGFVGRVNLGDNVWRFELRGTTGDSHAKGEHPHFVCLQCGEITCLADVRVKLSPAPGSVKSVVSTISDIVLKGQCTRCA
ncbi:MAG: transcriptional repressor [Nannocystis sp.]|nr:transcriptional repressor [Nannocystis sp.]MBA3547118.1 transcriptional repressor [Nannocystis sp.]